MARHTGPRNKRARRLGADLGLKTNPKSLERRINTLPGQHGRRGRSKLSDFAVQLMEKQKAKAIYGVLERQFKNYYALAAKTPSATGAVMLSLLETRLDNCVYRLGFAPTRRSARQLVTHGNVTVNGQKLSIPSYRVQAGQTVALSTKAAKIPYVKALIEDKDYSPPAWLKRKASVGQVTRPPERQDITEAINEQLIVEFYSR